MNQRTHDVNVSGDMTWHDHLSRWCFCCGFSCFCCRCICFGCRFCFCCRGCVCCSFIGCLCRSSCIFVVIWAWLWKSMIWRLAVCTFWMWILNVVHRLATADDYTDYTIDLWWLERRRTTTSFWNNAYFLQFWIAQHAYRTIQGIQQLLEVHLNTPWLLWGNFEKHIFTFPLNQWMIREILVIQNEVTQTK